MKILLVGDVHWSETSSILRSQGKLYSTRLENLIESVQWVEDIASVSECGHVVYLGDFFDRSDLRAPEISALKEIKWSSVPKYFLLGNHEMGGSKGKFNSVDVLSSVGKVITEPEIETLFGCNILYLPYICEEDKKDSIVGYLKPQGGGFCTQEVKNTIIFSHNDIAGINYGPVLSTRGFDIADLRTHCDLCINGHIHNASLAADNVINIGNLTGQNFSEDGFVYKHRIFILDTTTLQLKAFDNPYAMYFYKVDVNEEDDVRKLDSIISKGVVSIRCKESLSQCVRDRVVSNPNIIESRITLISDTTSSGESTISELANTDYITTFKQFILDQLGNSEIVNEELMEISR